jgi:glycosyltransferase involved in cell wall biosynthesis
VICEKCRAFNKRFSSLSKTLSPEYEPQSNGLINVKIQQSNRLHHRNQKRWPVDLPLISVIVPCFNYGQFLPAALDSVLSQTFADIEVLVVDGGSTDAITVETVKSISDPRVKTYVRDSHHLVGDNRNFGIERAKGKYVCCLDPDDFFEPTYLEKALFALECAGYDVVSTSYRYFGEKTDQVHVPRQPTFAQVVGGASMPSVVMLTKELWRQVGKYRDTGVGEKHIAEDWDFLVRLAGHGCRMLNLQEPLLNVRWHAESLSRRADNRSIDWQRQEIRRLNAKLLRFPNYRNFVATNDCHVFTINGQSDMKLRQSRAIRKNAASVLCVPTSPEPIRTAGAEPDQLLLISTLSSYQVPPGVLASYRKLTADVFFLPDVVPSPDAMYGLAEYLIQTRNATSILDNSGILRAVTGNDLSKLFDVIQATL